MNPKRMWIITLVFVLAAVCGCGGGTEGSGLRTYEGTVVTRSSRPLSGVLLTVLETGDSTTTDLSGRFKVESAAAGTVNFSLLLGESEGEFLLADVDEASTRVSMTVEFDVETEIAAIRELVIKAGIIDECDQYFENRPEIRQSSRVPEGTICSMKVWISGDGTRLNEVPIALQVRGCESDREWRTLEVHRTHHEGDEDGVTIFDFPFVDSPQTCEYRVVAPYVEGTHHAKEVGYTLETFSEQARELHH